jgi:putative transposase
MWALKSTAPAIAHEGFAYLVARGGIEPGKPQQNACIESFNGKFGDECLNKHWFLSMRHAQAVIADWQLEYNELRRHSALGYRTPKEFVASFFTSRLRFGLELNWGSKSLQPGNLRQYPYVEQFDRTAHYEGSAQYLFEPIDEVQEFATRWLWN